MQFENNQLYHIYNQGNNRQKIFFNSANYLFFMNKIRTYILPYADIFAYCLMPNHFHLMVLVRKVEVEAMRYAPISARLGVFQKHTESQPGSQPSSSETKLRTFNASIGILQMAYAKAINKQQKRSGKLFREQTKAECITCINGLTPSFYTLGGITRINIQNPENQYPQHCFDYIHQNPVKAGLVKKSTDWEFSSARDYAGMREGYLINKSLVREYVDF